MPEEQMTWDEVEDRPSELYWNPVKDGEPGDCIVGEVAALDHGKFGLYALLVLSDGSERQTPEHRNLSDKLLDVSIGDTIRICYIGSEDTGQPSPMARYSLFIGRKKG